MRRHHSFVVRAPGAIGIHLVGVELDADGVGRAGDLALEVVQDARLFLGRVEADVAEDAGGEVARHGDRLVLGGETIVEPGVEAQRVGRHEAGAGFEEHGAGEDVARHVRHVHALRAEGVGRREHGVEAVAHEVELFAVARGDVGAVEVQRVDDRIDDVHVVWHGRDVEVGGHGGMLALGARGCNARGGQRT
jgi:hypothetical protein